MSKVTVIDHPLIQHKLTLIRNKRTSSKDFRTILNEISMLMGYEVTRDIPVREVETETPIGMAKTKIIAGKKLAVVPILRAGLGMVDGLLSLMPSARVGHIGLYRDPETHLPVEYYCKLPPGYLPEKRNSRRPDARDRRQCCCSHRFYQAERCHADKDDESGRSAGRYRGCSEGTSRCRHICCSDR